MEGYTAALVAAGATVHEINTAGSYQGYWLARVTTADGREGFVLDSFGSCSGCDAFEAEFAFDSHRYEHEGNDTNGWLDITQPETFREGCASCDALWERLVKFGADYLRDSFYTTDGLVATTLAENLIPYDKAALLAEHFVPQVADASTREQLLAKLKEA
jgi:hypothetical protein